jgi:hypothetical protein
MKLDTRNLYFSGTGMIYITGGKTDNQGSVSYLTAVSKNIGTKVWKLASQGIDPLGTFNGALSFIGSTFNDELYIVLYRETGGLYILRVYTTLQVDITETIPTLSLTDVRASKDFVEQALLDVVIDGTDRTGTELVKISNSLNSKFSLHFNNGETTNGLSGEDQDSKPKTFAPVIKINVDESNAFTNNINKVSYGDIQEARLDKYTKNFNACTHMYVQGIIDKVPTIGSGGFDS